MMSRWMRASALAFPVGLGISAWGQAPPDSWFRLRYDQLEQRSLTPAGMTIGPTRPSTSGTRDWAAVFVDPATGRMWGLDDTYLLTPSLTEIVLTPTSYSLGLSIALPDVGWNDLAGMGFNDRDELEIVPYGRTAYAIDLDSGRVRSWRLSHFSTVYEYMPAVAGRPAVAFGDVSFTLSELALLDDNGAYIATIPGPTTGGRIYTTKGGRTFVSSGGLAELDYSTRSLVPRSHPMTLQWAAEFVEAPSRGLLYLRGLFDHPTLGAGVFAVYDLQRNLYTYVSNDPVVSISGFKYQATWFPQDQLTIRPRCPPSNAPMIFRMATGGYPSELGLLYFHRALIGGTLITSIATPMAVAPFNDRGLLALEVPYDPVLHGVMNPGDQLVFEGFRLAGSQIHATSEIAITWQ